MPENTPLTDLAAVKAVLGIAITITDQDVPLGYLVSSVSAVISAYCNRNFGTATYTETYNGSGNSQLWLRQRPIQSVSSLTVGGVTVQPRTNPYAYGYAFDQNQLYLNGGCFPEWPAQAVVVIYTAGITVSAAATPDLWTAAAEWVAAEYKSQSHIEKGSDTTGEGQSTVYLKSMPWHVRHVVDLYRQVSTEQVLGN